MAMTVYRSTDSGAPSIPYATGGLITLLDACLRTGYGSKAGAGWTKPFTSGSTIACFKQGTGGNNRFVRVWDARAGDDAATYCRTANVRGYENMTAVSTGTGPFPTTGQVASNGLMVRYACAAPTYPASWIVRATPFWFDVMINIGYFEASGLPGVAYYDQYFSFGTFPSLKSGDLYNDMIMAGVADAYYYQPHLGEASNQMFVARSDTGTIGAKPLSLKPCAPINVSSMGEGEPSTYPYPNRPNNSVLLHQYAIHSDGYLRGTLPGVWGSQHGVSVLGFGNTIGGQGALAGKSFEIVSCGSSNSGLILETSDTFTAI